MRDDGGLDQSEVKKFFKNDWIPDLFGRQS